MPVFEFVFHGPANQTDRALLRDGALIPVEIGVPAPLEAWCAQQSIPLPAPRSGYALIDTGASISAIDEELLLELEIAPIDSIPLATPNGDSDNFVYPAKVSFPAIDMHGF